MNAFFNRLSISTLVSFVVAIFLNGHLYGADKITIELGKDGFKNDLESTDIKESHLEKAFSLIKISNCIAQIKSNLYIRNTGDEWSLRFHENNNSMKSYPIGDSNKDLHQAPVVDYEAFERALAQKWSREYGEDQLVFFADIIKRRVAGETLNTDDEQHYQTINSFYEKSLDDLVLSIAIFGALQKPLDQYWKRTELAQKFAEHPRIISYLKNAMMVIKDTDSGSFHLKIMTSQNAKYFAIDTPDALVDLNFVPQIRYERILEELKYYMTDIPVDQLTDLVSGLDFLDANETKSEKGNQWLKKSNEVLGHFFLYRLVSHVNDRLFRYFGWYQLN